MPDQRVGLNLPPSDGGVSARRSLAVWIWSVLLIADAALVARRLSGEFVFPLSGDLAFLSTALVAAASWTAWFISAASFSQRSVHNSTRLIPRGISLAVTVLWGWSISPAAAPLTCGLLLAVIVLQVGALLACEVGWDSDPGFLRLVPALAVHERPVEVVCQPSEAPAFPQLSNELATRHSPLATPSEFDEEEVDESDISDENCTLWLSRRQTADGEQIEGWVRVDFATGQRETVIHMAFCPPLSGFPEIETEDLNGIGLEIRVAAVFPFGARLSVRRNDALDERHTDRIGFVAQVRSADRAA